MEKTFAEEFPSLKIKEQTDIELKDLRYTHWTMEQLLKDIQEHCFDKQRVRDIFFKYRIAQPVTEPMFRALEEELGL